MINIKGEFFMKNLVIALMAVLISISAASAYNYITEKQTIFYNPQKSIWTLMPETEDDIQITNKSFIGSGGFCEYYYQDGKLAIGPEINIGFVNDGEFIGINSQELKFYKYKYQDKKFVSELLTQEEIQKLYPEYKIIKVSEFKNNEITINKKFFEKINVLLLNDTEQSFYKYSYKPASVNPEYIKPFIHISHPGKIIFSHYGNDTKETPALKIIVKNKL